MYEQIDCRLAEYAIAWRCVFTHHRVRIDACEWSWLILIIFCDKSLPGLYYVFLINDAVEPAHFRLRVFYIGRNPLDIKRRSWNYVMYRRRSAEQHYGRARGPKFPALLYQISPFIKKVVIRNIFVMARIDLIKAIAIPVDRLFVERFFKRKVEYLAVPAVLGRITQQALDLRHGSLLISSATADKRLADISMKVYRLMVSRRFWNIKSKNRLAIDSYEAFLYADIMVHLIVRPKRAQKVVLDLIDKLDADGLVVVFCQRYAENYPAAIGVSKCRYGLIDGFRNFAPRFLELDVVPFMGF